MYRINSCGQLTRRGPSAWGWSEELTSPHFKTINMILNALLPSVVSCYFI